MQRTQGQASVETAVMLPLLLVLALSCWQALLVGWTAVSAEHAARAAARAALVGEPPRPAAERSLMGALRSGLAVERRGSELRVRLSVPAVIPGFSMTLSAAAESVRQ